MKKIIFILSIAFSVSTYAQQDDSRVENAKKEFLINELKLSDEESAVFFPIYNEYTQKKREARKSLKQAKAQSENSAENSVDRIIDREQELIDIQKLYFDKLKKVISEKKVVQLMEAEKKFKLMMIQKFKGR